MASMPTVTGLKETSSVTPASDTQHQLLQTQEIISQLSNVIQLLIPSLNSSTSTNHNQPQVSMPNDESAETLSEVSDNPPLPPIATTDNQHTSNTENLFTAANRPQLSTTQSSPVSLPAVPTRQDNKG